MHIACLDRQPLEGHQLVVDGIFEKQQNNGIGGLRGDANTTRLGGGRSKDINQRLTPHSRANRTTENNRNAQYPRGLMHDAVRVVRSMVDTDGGATSMGS